MPELPEVETIKRALKAELIGHKFVRIDTFIESVRYSLAPLKAPVLLNSEVISVRRRARYLIIEMANLHAFIIHLGMSGSLRIVPEKEKRMKHEHVIWHINDGMSLRFDCPRRFGFVKTCKLLHEGAEPHELNQLGPEPLSEEFNAKYLFDISRNRKGAIKSLIMNNAAVVGVGNIYVSEALFSSRINPTRKAMTLTKKECTLLVAEIKKVLQHSIEIGGTTFSSYKQLDGSTGKFVLHLLVYGKAGEACSICGTTIKEKRISGRSSCYCPKCQK